MDRADAGRNGGTSRAFTRARRPFRGSSAGLLVFREQPALVPVFIQLEGRSISSVTLRNCRSAMLGLSGR